MEEIRFRLPELYENIIEDERCKNWEKIKSDLEKLSWLNYNSPKEVFRNYIMLADCFGIDQLNNGEDFSVLQLKVVQDFISTLMFQLTEKSIIVDMFEFSQEYFSKKFQFFSVSKKRLSEQSSSIDSIIEKISKVFKEISEILNFLIIYIDFKYQKKFKKSFTHYLNYLFSHEVLLGIQYYHKNSIMVRSIIAEYEIKPQSMRSYYPMPDRTITNYYYGELDEDSRRAGFGRLLLENGDKYEGFWTNNKMHGEGLYIWKKNGWYKGEFVNGEIMGKGTRTFLDGSSYEGEFYKGRRHGTGKMTYSNGDVYVGAWSSDAINGEGEYTWFKTKDVFKGKFRYDEKTKGILKLSSGEEHTIN